MFKNRSFNVKMVKDSDQEKMEHPVPFDATDIRMTMDDLATNVVATYMVIKGFKTICSIIEHVVVTKVK